MTNLSALTLLVYTKQLGLPAFYDLCDVRQVFRAETNTIALKRSSLRVYPLVSLVLPLFVRLLMLALALVESCEYHRTFDQLTL